MKARKDPPGAYRKRPVLSVSVLLATGLERGRADAVLTSFASCGERARARVDGRDGRSPNIGKTRGLPDPNSRSITTKAWEDEV